MRSFPKTFNWPSLNMGDTISCAGSHYLKETEKELKRKTSFYSLVFWDARQQGAACIIWDLRYGDCITLNRVPKQVPPYSCLCWTFCYSNDTEDNETLHSCGDSAEPICRGSVPQERWPHAWQPMFSALFAWSGLCRQQTTRQARFAFKPCFSHTGQGRRTTMKIMAESH